MPKIEMEWFNPINQSMQSLNESIKEQKKINYNLFREGRSDLEEEEEEAKSIKS